MHLRFFFLGCLLIGLAAQPAQAAELSVTVSGVRNDRADVRIALYADAETFRHEKDAKQVLSVAAHPGTVRATFHDIAPGRYAVIAYHDENGNQKLDMILGMFPDEGWGLSNDPSVLGPPPFADSAFDVGDDGAAVTVPLHY